MGAQEEQQSPLPDQDEPGESLKHFVIYFKSQMILVYNCNDYVVVAAFISEL